MTNVSLCAQQPLDIDMYLPTYSTLAIQKDAPKIETF